MKMKFPTDHSFRKVTIYGLDKLKKFCDLHVQVKYTLYIHVHVHVHVCTYKTNREYQTHVHVHVHTSVEKDGRNCL